ncbi:hypothetical protein ccbrp13_33640 [Ktedonobacteria bacterium brp13]|nr:hypothetical protein ccbrp13_33640 [Ktedonobacteria bacterium brp13]
MNESIIRTMNHFSPTASLAAIGVKLRQLDVFGPIRTQVQIRQKTIKHTPTDKLSDAWISLLAGVMLQEVNRSATVERKEQKRIRHDRAEPV